jgi:coiled-coil domain-containing protein 55
VTGCVVLSFADPPDELHGPDDIYPKNRTENNFLLQPRYITGLLKKAKEREKAQEMVMERKIQKEQAAEAHLYGDKEKFVTGAYKRKLAEDAKWQEEERRREELEKANEVRVGGLGF